jgi:hypothetical protein
VVRLLLDRSINLSLRNALGQVCVCVRVCGSVLSRLGVHLPIQPLAQTAGDLLERIPRTKAQDIRALLSGHITLSESPDVIHVACSWPRIPGHCHAPGSGLIGAARWPQARAKEDYAPGVYDQAALVGKGLEADCGLGCHAVTRARACRGAV